MSDPLHAANCPHFECAATQCAACDEVAVSTPHEVVEELGRLLCSSSQHATPLVVSPSQCSRFARALSAVLDKAR